MSMHADALAFEMRRHAEQRADRDDAGAADAGDDDVVGLVDARQRRLAAAAAPVSPSASRLRRLLQLRAAAR